jgi:hypothetical protein
MNEEKNHEKSEVCLILECDTVQYSRSFQYFGGTFYLHHHGTNVGNDLTNYTASHSITGQIM